MADVALNSVTKRFGATTAVSGLTLRVDDAEFVVLLGPTGAGKTTTLRLIAGLETPDSGTVQIGGQDVTARAPADRDVAFVFQQYSLYPHYTVFDNLAFPLRAPGRKWSEPELTRRVKEIAEMLRIESKLANRATQLSGGEMQRVSIGRALVRSPNVFLMDEPLSSLDAKLREDLRVELKRIQRDLGATIVYVTHDQVEAMTLGDRIGVLSDGAFVQIGTPHEIYETPLNIYSARRLGSPHINLVKPGILDVKQPPADAETLGVRPEDILLGHAGGVSAEVLTVEHLGAETVVLMRVNGEQVHALMGDEVTVHEGASTHIGVRPGAEMYFDASGIRLGAPNAA